MMKHVYCKPLAQRNGAISRRVMLAFAMAAAALCWHAPAAAQADWPSKPIRFIVGFSAGGPTDNFARVLAKKLGDQLGQPVLVENRVGANANIAADMVAHSTPDGYTFLYNSSSLAISASLYKNLRYDMRKDLVPVSLLMSLPTVLVATPTLPVSTLADLVAYLKANPNKLNYASGGIGNAQHLGMAIVLNRFGLKASHTPYKGSSPAHIDLLAGRTQLMVDTVSSVLPYIKDKRLKAIATLSLERVPDLAGIPTMHESGMPGFELEGWYGVMAPTGTSKAIVQRLHAEITKAMNSDELRATLATQSGRAIVAGPEKYADYLLEEAARYAEVIKALAISVD